MALRLFSKINRNLFRTFKIQTSTSQSLKHTRAQENNNNEFVLKNEEDILMRAKRNTLAQNDIKLTNSPVNCLSNTNAQLTSLIPPSALKLYYLGPLVSQARFYSSPDSDKCKAVKGKDKRCKKFNLCNCEKSKFKTCRVTIKDSNCKKKQAPYPSFSEACYEEPYNKPSECRMCPWKPNVNPSFRGTVKVRKYHTGKPWMPLEDKILGMDNTNLRQRLLTERSTLLSQILENEHNIDGVSSPVEWLLAKKKKKGKCKKFPFKKEKFEIGKKSKKEDCNAKPKCVKKKKKPIKDCPKKKKDCSQHTGVLHEDLVEGLLMKDDKCRTKEIHDTCEDSGCHKKECPKKKTKKMICPTGLVRKRGHKDKPKKKKSAPFNELPFPLTAIYNSGMSQIPATKQI